MMHDLYTIRDEYVNVVPLQHKTTIMKQNIQRRIDSTMASDKTASLIAFPPFRNTVQHLLEGTSPLSEHPPALEAYNRY